MAPDLSKSAFEDERYLQPVLADDPLLYSLNEIVESVRITKKLKINGVMESVEKDGETNANGTHATSSKREDSALDRINKLEEELKRLQRNFAEYREVVDKTLENRWNSTEDTSSTTDVYIRPRGKITVPRDDDTHYFSSYSFNGQLS